MRDVQKGPERERNSERDMPKSSYAVSSEGIGSDPVVKRLARQMHSRLRKLLTGDENKRIRDHIEERKEVPSNVMLIDKLVFTFGVFNIAIFQYFMLNIPRYYWMYHTAILSALMAIRFKAWKKLKWQYFLLDNCYFSNVWLLCCCFFGLDRYKTFFNACFITCVGPLPIAVFVWRISLVFHEYDKVTSVLVHILPAMLCYTMRWHGNYLRSSRDFKPHLEWQDFICAACMYLIWQGLYFFKTEIKDKSKLDKDLEIQTSLRMLSTDKKNAFARAVLRLYQRIGVMKPEEDFEPTEFKTKFIFMLTQFIYTLSTMAIAPFVYSSKTFHLIYIAFTFWTSTYFGAQYYIEVFSKRYQLQFADKIKLQQILKAATEVAFESATSNDDASNVNCDSARDDPRGVEVDERTNRNGESNEDSNASTSKDPLSNRNESVTTDAVMTKMELVCAATAAFVDQTISTDTTYDFVQPSDFFRAGLAETSQQTTTNDNSVIVDDKDIDDGGASTAGVFNGASHQGIAGEFAGLDADEHYCQATVSSVKKNL